MQPVKKWRGKQQLASWTQNTRHLSPSATWSSDVLQNIRREDGIKFFVSNGQRAIEIGELVDVPVFVKSFFPVDAYGICNQISVHPVKRHLAAAEIEKPPPDMGSDCPKIDVRQYIPNQARPNSKLRGIW